MRGLNVAFAGSMVLLVWTGAASEPWTLPRALNEANKSNPDVRLARQRVAAAQAGLEQANAAAGPRLQFQSSYTRTDNPMMVFGSILNQRAYPYPPEAPLNFNDVPDVDNLNVKGLATMPLYAGGRISANRNAARASVDASAEESQAVRNALAFEVTRAFHTIQKTRSFVRAADAAVNSLEENLSVARKRLEAGTLLKTDVLDFEVRLAQAREDLVRARNAQALAVRVLRNLLGVEEVDFTVSLETPEVARPATEEISNRPELAAARLRERAASEQLRSARGARLPTLSAFGSLDYDYGWEYDSDGSSYTVGALLQWDIWDGNSTRAKVREARANLESAREEQRKVRLALDLEAEEARLALQSAEERLAATEKAVAQAEESVTMNRSRFEQGAALSSQLIDAQTALVAARVRRAEAEADQRIAIAALRKAYGFPQLDGNPAASQEAGGK
jgi:outer membrane protein TolC